MKKATLKGTFYVSEVDEIGNSEEYDITKFEKGEEVMVLHEDVYDSGKKLYVIYSPRAKEATAVYDGLLEFIE